MKRKYSSFRTYGERVHRILSPRTTDGRHPVLCTCSVCSSFHYVLLHNIWER